MQVVHSADIFFCSKPTNETYTLKYKQIKISVAYSFDLFKYTLSTYKKKTPLQEKC